MLSSLDTKNQTKVLKAKGAHLRIRCAKDKYPQSFWRQQPHLILESIKLKKGHVNQNLIKESLQSMTKTKTNWNFVCLMILMLD